MKLKYLVKNNKYKNINEILSLEFKLSTRLKNKLIKNNRIFLNDNVCDTRIPVKIGDKLIIDFNYNEDNSNIVPTEMNLDIVYEDEWLLVVNKPSGITIHPSILHFNNIHQYFILITLYQMEYAFILIK